MDRTQLSSECSKLREAITLHIELFLTDHLSYFDAFERGGSRVKRFEPEHWARSSFDKPMILLKPVVD